MSKGGLIGWLLAPLLLAAVAVANSGALLFPDSLAYLHYGDTLWRGQMPLPDRPVFYGLAIFPLHADVSLWPVVFAQALVLAWALRSLGVSLRGLAVLVLLTPVAWHLAFVMPDIFAGTLVLSMFRLALGQAGIRWHLLAGFSVLVHPTHLVIGIVLWAVARVRVLLIPIVLATGLGLGFNALVFGQAALNPGGPPFALGRLLADGPALAYLREVCPTAGFALCADVDRMPKAQWQILWLPDSPLKTSYGFRPEVMAEAGAIVKGTVLAHPGWVAYNAGRAFLQQLITIDSELVTGPLPEQVAQWTPYVLPGFMQTWQTHGLAASPILAAANRLHRWVYWLGFAAMLALLPGWLRAGRRQLLLLAGMVAAALLTNAALVAVFSEVVGRYQGRLSWLVPLVLWVAFREGEAWKRESVEAATADA